MRGRPRRGNRRARRIERMIEEAVVDAYTRSEQESGFLVALEQHVECPFPARVIGEDVVVDGFELDSDDPCVMAICSRNRKQYKVSATSIEWKGRPPRGALWVEAYREWLRSAG